MNRIRDLADLARLRDALAEESAAKAAREKAARVAAEAARREANLFRDAVGAVEPLKTPARAQHAMPRPLPIARQHERDERAALAESLSNEFEPGDLLETDGELSWKREGVGGDVLRKLRRGHWVVQAELDLHGARVDEAREWLATFLHDATKRHLRCVRVVHGKGLGSVGKQPVLKGKVKRWLAQKDEVLAFCQPPEHDGGGGALLVLLRPC